MRVIGPSPDELNAFRETLDLQRVSLEERLVEIHAQTKPVGLDLPIGRLSRMDTLHPCNHCGAVGQPCRGMRGYTDGSKGIIAERCDFALTPRSPKRSS
jgi:hypothetical protein